MGQIPKKTYTAPDGSVYRVEADGSVTKIKSGKVQADESQPKYNITPDGKIYRVESNGSVTYIGNAEEMQNPLQLPEPTPGSNNSGLKWGLIIITILVVAAAILGIYLVYDSIQRADATSEKTEIADTVAKAQDTAGYQGNDVPLSEDTIGGSAISSEATAEESAIPEENPVFYPGGIEGTFKGVIDGLGTISGVWTCGSQMGGGWYCVDGQNESSMRDLNFVNEDPLVWSECNMEKEPTGTWYFDYFDGTKDQIATGTYVRSSDNRRFRFTLYKDK